LVMVIVPRLERGLILPGLDTAEMSWPDHNGRRSHQAWLRCTDQSSARANSSRSN